MNTEDRKDLMKVSSPASRLKARIESINTFLEDMPFKVSFAEKPINNGFKFGFYLKDGSNVQMIAYWQPGWESMSDSELAKQLRNAYTDSEIHPQDVQRMVGNLSQATIYPKLLSSNNKNRYEKQGAIIDTFLDMIVVYEARAKVGDLSYTVLVTEVNLPMFDVTREQLQQVALVNLEKKARVCSMASMLGLDESALDINMSIAAMDDKSSGGAATMLLQSIRSELARRYDTDKLVILPSSIDECLAIPYEPDCEARLLEMVREINETEVEPQLRLTDSIYLMEADDKGGYSLKALQG